MSDEQAKSFFKITGMSDSFREYEDGIDKDADPTLNDGFELRLWQTRAELAIAQQLSIIAKHLGKIVEGSEILRAQKLEPEVMKPKSYGD